MKELIELLNKYDYIMTERPKSCTFDIDLEGYGTISGEFDFEYGQYEVSLEMSEEEYMGLFFVNEDEIDEEDLDAWNTTKRFNNLAKAVEEIINTISVINSECGGALDAPVEFMDKLESLKFE